MKYQVLLRRLNDQRAPEVVAQSDYDDIGIFEADSKALAIHEVTKTTKYRRLSVGDVIIDEYGIPYIFTPFFHWSIVTLE